MVSAAVVDVGSDTMRAKKVLVIDDSLKVLESMKNRLEALGVEVILADGAGMGIDAARQRKPDLILLDRMTPESSSDEVATALMGYPETMAIPVVFMSGLPEPSVLPKHLQRDELTERLQDILSVRDY